jgi:uncharacterized protein (TIGR00730 family)
MRKRFCVFCGSSSGVRPEYTAAAQVLAQHLVVNEISIVYGGGRTGLMGTLADAALAAGGEVIGIIPQALVEKEVAHHGLSDLRIVDSMHQRKAQMAELADGFIAMPGGYGTFEEFCEILTWKQLGLVTKPFGLLNVAGYYDSMLAMFDHAVGEQLLKPAHRDFVLADTDPERLIRRMLGYEAPAEEKWITARET